MSLAGLPLTFGVELEFVFAVHTHEIEQDPAHFLHGIFEGVQQGGGGSESQQTSEAFFTGPTVNPVPSEADNVGEQETSVKHAFNAAEYVARILRNAGQTVRIQNEPHRRPNFQVWQVTYDNSVKLDDGAALIKLFPNRVTPENVSQWKHDGMELVSRVLLATEYDRGCLHSDSLREVEKFLTALTPRPQDPWLVSAHNRTGLHVHVGVDPESQIIREIPLPVLQHLAYILARYEEIVSSLHSDQRRGYPNTFSSLYATSNLMGIRGDAHCCGQITLPTLTEIQKMIFAADMTPAKLAALMGSEGQGGEGNRFKFVNWTNISARATNAEKPRTVEFRQHEGTLSLDEIVQWVCFLTALMRTAERRANENTPPTSPTKPAIPRDQLSFAVREGSKYKFVCTNQRDKTDEFFDLLELPRQTRDYWMKRYEKYSPETFTKMPYSKICALCERDEQMFQVEQEIRDAVGDGKSKQVQELDEKEIEFNEWVPEEDGDESGEDQVFSDEEEDDLMDAD